MAESSDLAIASLPFRNIRGRSSRQSWTSAAPSGASEPAGSRHLSATLWVWKTAAQTPLLASIYNLAVAGVRWPFYTHPNSSLPAQRRLQMGQKLSLRHPRRSYQPSFQACLVPIPPVHEQLASSDGSIATTHPPTSPVCLAIISASCRRCEKEPYGDLFLDK